MDRLSKVNSEGIFESPIKSPDQRFALSLGGLSAGRIILTNSMYFNLSRSLAIALRFSVMRKQFGDPKSDKEEELISYPLHQYRLFPYVAQVFSFCNLVRYISQNWVKKQSKIFLPGNFKLAELHAIISVAKPIVSW